MCGYFINEYLNEYEYSLTNEKQIFVLLVSALLYTEHLL